MARDALLAKRRIQFIVRECSCPGLIDSLSLIPEGAENVFIRAVLTEWFSSNAQSGNSAEVAAGRLVDKYRVVEFRNANGIRGDVGAEELPSGTTNHSVVAEVPLSHLAERKVLVESTPASVAAREEKIVVESPVHIPKVTDLPAPPNAVVAIAPVAPVAPVPSLHVDFDPDQF